MNEEENLMKDLFRPPHTVWKFLTSKIVAYSDLYDKNIKRDELKNIFSDQGFDVAKFDHHLRYLLNNRILYEDDNGISMVYNE